MATVRRLGVLTGGGDAPGLNAVIRAVVKACENRAIECYGIPDSYDGLLEADRSFRLTRRDVTGILRLGQGWGTMSARSSSSHRATRRAPTRSVCSTSAMASDSTSSG